jgi:hypothetical protein
MANSTENVKHKPSKKVVLEDVLTSLQDLVNNEFANDFADAPRTRDSDDAPNVLKKGSAQDAAGLRKRGRPRKYPLPPAETARKAKKPVADRENYTYSQEQADLFTETPPVAESAGKTTRSPETIAARPRPTARPTEAKPAPKKMVRTLLETPRQQTNLKVVSRPEPDTGSAPRKEFKIGDMAHKPSNTAEHFDSDTSLGWADDIPVLTEVVDPRTLEMKQLQDVVDRSLERKDLAPEAREIAVKVAAKLNIEMRQSGKQLDIKTIMRLQALLKEALEPKG